MHLCIASLHVTGARWAGFVAERKTLPPPYPSGRPPADAPSGRRATSSGRPVHAILVMANTCRTKPHHHPAGSKEAVSIAETGRQQLVWLAETLLARSDIDTHLRAAAGITVTNPAEGAALWARISPYGSSARTGERRGTRRGLFRTVSALLTHLSSRV